MSVLLVSGGLVLSVFACSVDLLEGVCAPGLGGNWFRRGRGRGLSLGLLPWWCLLCSCRGLFAVGFALKNFVWAMQLDLYWRGWIPEYVRWCGRVGVLMVRPVLWWCLQTCSWFVVAMCTGPVVLDRCVAGACVVSIASLDSATLELLRGPSVSSIMVVLGVSAAAVCRMQVDAGGRQVWACWCRGASRGGSELFLGCSRLRWCRLLWLCRAL